jgi:hypothetical protein
VDFIRCYVPLSRVGVDGKGSFSRRSTLVNPRKPKTDEHIASPPPAFSPNEMRHNFAIWPLKDSDTSKGRWHLYSCVRCKWSFRIDDRGGSVIPLDQNGSELQKCETAERLATFDVGPCPVFHGLAGSGRLTQVITHRESLLSRLVHMLYAIRRIWKRPDRKAGDNPLRVHRHESKKASSNECEEPIAGWTPDRDLGARKYRVLRADKTI